jgi:DNA-binding GntR family transcriptional regulator
VLNEFFENEKNVKFKIQTHRHFIELCRAKKKEEAIKVWSEFIEHIHSRLLKNIKN